MSVHDERLPNRTCDHCGEEFYSDTAKKYCSRDCLIQSSSYSGENNPNFKGGKTTTECQICGCEFEFYQSEKPGKYCSDCVENQHWQTAPELNGSENPQWTGGKIERSCDLCGTKVERRRSAFSETVTLCSRECHREWISDAFTGEGHPNWKGGGSEYYGQGWRQAKRRTLERDDHTCVLCGATKDDLGRNPDVHHIVPVRRFIEAEAADKADAHVPRNLVTLCVTCHRRADFGTPSPAELKRLTRNAE